MPAEHWDELSADEKADLLRKWFDAFDATERKNVQERGYRFGKIEKRLSELEEAVKQIQSRLDQLERRNHP